MSAQAPMTLMALDPRLSEFVGARAVALTRLGRRFALTIGCPALQENAFWNSGMFCSVPLTR